MSGGRVIEALERHQVVLYLAAIAFGVAVGLAWQGSPALDHAIEPVMMALLFATFLAVPFRKIGAALRDTKFLLSLGALNFVVAPLVAYGLTRFIASDAALLIGALLVLLTPCIDYVIVFAGLAGGSAEKLLAAAPLLMLAQMLLLPLYLLVFVGPTALEVVDVMPFVRAFLLLIVLPLAAAAVVQRLAARFVTARSIERGVLSAMVPLMMATLSVVIASQVRGVGEQAGALLRVVPVYITFAVLITALGIVAGRLARLNAADTRALAFSGVTRNSLVVLPLALALPASLSLAPLVVVTQTIIELVTMIVLVRVLPSLVRER